ncbi:MAG: hypothetical protein R3C14_38960 [Caldilineaceae bacterium]
MNTSPISNLLAGICRVQRPLPDGKFGQDYAWTLALPERRYQATGGYQRHGPVAVWLHAPEPAMSPARQRCCPPGMSVANAA